jgi:hypothetical protein
MHQAKNLSDVAERFAALTERQQQVLRRAFQRPPALSVFSASRVL